MFSYQSNEMNLKLHPNPIECDLLDQKLMILDVFEQLSKICLRSALMIQNRQIYELLMKITMMNLNHMELVAAMIHQLRGVDAMYLDCSHDDVLCYETIDDDHIPLVKLGSNHDDFRIAFSYIKQVQEDLLKRLENASNILKNESKAFIKLIYQDQEYCYQKVKKIYDYYETHLDIKDFGEGLTLNQFDLDTSNYFDKPNPYYIK